MFVPRARMVHPFGARIERLMAHQRDAGRPKPGPQATRVLRGAGDVIVRSRVTLSGSSL